MPKSNLSPFLVYTKQYDVTSDYFSSSLTDQIDLTQMLNIALETAGHHDRLINDHLPMPLLSENQSWVITQSAIYLKQWPQMNDHLTVHTRVYEVNRFFVERYFEILCEGVLLMEIISQYAVIDLQNRKMARINTKLLTDLAVVDESIKFSFDKIRVPKNYVLNITQKRQILPVDIDNNQHVNNTVYLRWCYEMLPKEILSHYELESVAVKYGSELLSDDEAQIELHTPENFNLADEEFHTYQVVKNTSKGKDACYVRLSWRKLI